MRKMERENVKSLAEMTVGARRVRWRTLRAGARRDDGGAIRVARAVRVMSCRVARRCAAHRDIFYNVLQRRTLPNDRYEAGATKRSSGARFAAVEHLADTAREAFGCERLFQ